ncbi:hypothetical protein KY346_04925 [Candidatus Woesearchaeota archaeon]|nr:hypothetical protein [Candidatus Woesearchaeota archaeon]
MAVPRKTDFAIPLTHLTKLAHSFSLEKLVENAARQYTLKEEVAGRITAQIKKLVDSKNENILKDLGDIYTHHFNSLTAPARMILANICAEQAKRKIKWLKAKKLPNKERIKRTEKLLQQARERERAAAILCFLKPQKQFIDRLNNGREFNNLEEQIEKLISAADKARKIPRLAEFVIESPEENFMEEFYTAYDSLQCEDKEKCRQINEKKLELLLKHVKLPANFKNYYYRYASTMQKIAEFSSNKREILEESVDFLEKIRRNKSFNALAYIGLGNTHMELAKLGDAIKHLERASDAYHGALKSKNIKEINLAVISSKLCNCHMSKLRLTKDKSISERFLDYLQALRYGAEAHFAMSKFKKEEELADYKKKLGTTMFYLGRDLVKASEEEFSKIADLLKFYDPTYHEHFGKASDTVIKRVKSILLPGKYESQKDRLLIKIFNRARNHLKKAQAKERRFYDSLKISEQIARSCLHIGKLIPSSRKAFAEALTTLDEMIAKASQKKENKKITRKLSKFHNFRGEAHFRASQKGNVLDRIRNKAKAIADYAKVRELRKKLSKKAPRACYSMPATNYIEIAELVLEKRVCNNIPDICNQLNLQEQEAAKLAKACYQEAIKLLEHARSKGDNTPYCTTKIGKCYYGLAKLSNDLELISKAIEEFDKAIELDKQDDPYLPPHWFKAYLAAYFFKNDLSTPLDPAEELSKFLKISKRDYFRSITNCRVWRAKGRGAEEVKAIFKSPVDEKQTLKLEKLLIENKSDDYDVIWRLEDPVVLILEAKGTKTMNERIAEKAETVERAQKEKSDIITDEYRHFHDETMQLYKDAVTELVRNIYDIKEKYHDGTLRRAAEKEGFNLDDEIMQFEEEDYYEFADSAVDALDLRFGKCALSNQAINENTYVNIGDQYTKEHLKAILKEITRQCILPMKEGFDFDPNLDNVMIYDDEEKVRVACGIDFEKLKIRKYVAGLCMLLFYDNPKISAELSIKEAGNFLTPAHKKEIIDHFIEEELRIENDDETITINRVTPEERYEIHRDVTVYMPLRRMGLAGNEKRKLLEKSRPLTQEDIDLLKQRQTDDIEWLKSDVAYAIRGAAKEPGKLYGRDLRLFVILHDIIKDMEVIP